MINYDSILSAFDGKPTLLQWLKMVKKALDESILKNVDITQNGQKVVFTFNFEDGTSISTPEVTLPKGNDGVSITGINTVGNEVVGDETLTTLRANYSNNTADEFVVTAKNGKDAVSGESSIYTHFVRFNSGSSSSYMSILVYSKKENLTLEDALSQIPTSDFGIPAYFKGGTYEGVLSAYRIGNNLKIRGVVYNSSTSIAEMYNANMTPSSITDNLLGVNL